MDAGDAVLGCVPAVPAYSGHAPGSLGGHSPDLLEHGGGSERALQRFCFVCFSPRLCPVDCCVSEACLEPGRCFGVGLGEADVQEATGTPPSAGAPTVPPHTVPGALALER